MPKRKRTKSKPPVVAIRPVRFTEEEDREIREAAARAEMPLSMYIRRRAIREAKHENKRHREHAA